MKIKTKGVVFWKPESGGVSPFSTSLLTLGVFYKILGLFGLMPLKSGYYFCLSRPGMPVDNLFVNICKFNKSEPNIYKCLHKTGFACLLKKRYLCARDDT